MKQKRKKSAHVSELSLADVGRIEVICKKKHEELLLTGVLRILRYGSDQMRFMTKAGVLGIEGSELDCVIYANGSIGLVGRMTSLSLTRGEEIK